MQMVKGTLILLVSLWFSLIAFMPKEELYYALEHRLVKYGIELNEKSIKSGIFSMDISDIDVYVEGIKIAHIDHINFLITLVFNTIDISDIILDNTLNSLIHINIKKIQKAYITYSITSPLKAKISLDGDFGKAQGYIDTNRSLRLNFSEPKNLKSLRYILKKDDNGWYYETKF